MFFGVRYAFDKESLENIKNSTIIKQAILVSTGCKARIAAKIIKKEVSVALDAAQALADALTVFGGELVE